MPPVEYISIQQAAQRLQLHVRTVRNYVRSGRLKAVRVGKQYRIAPEDMDALTGPPAAALPSERAIRRRHTHMLSIVDIDVIDAEGAARLNEAIKTMARGWHKGYKPLHVETLYDLERKRLKLILGGDLAGVCDVVGMIDLLAGAST
jgi:excisionase family DNA binding protein